jgi:predicted transposase YdaD
MSFDNVCKLIAEKYPVDFVRWLTADDARNVKFSDIFALINWLDAIS